MNRLTLLRGQGMPHLYSWSCKRSYRNGYVWNDLAENDVIHPTDGAEYVLKGSEVVEGCPVAERLQQLQVTNGNRQLIQEPSSSSFHQKRKQLYQEYEEDEEQEEEEQQEQESQEEYEDEEKTSYTSSTTPHSRCSRGVSTDELEDNHQQPANIKTESTHNDSPPPPLTTPSNSILSETRTHQPITSKRFEDGDPAPAGRNSVLLQLIACGNLSVSKAKNNLPSLKQQSAVRVLNPNPNNGGAMIKRSESDLHRGVLYKNAVKVGGGEEEEDMIRYMSENPRFGNLQSEEKEYFSGSIVESMSENRVAEEPAAALKRSNSYKEERKAKIEEEEEAVKEVIKEKGVRGKCIPLKKSSSSSKHTKK